MMTTTKRTTVKVTARAVGIALVVSLATVPAMAGGSRGDAGRAQPKAIVAVFASTMAGSLILDGCAPSPEARPGCESRMRMVSGTTPGNPCTVDAVFLNGTQQSGSCALSNGGTRSGTAFVKVSNARCDRISVYGMSDPRMYLTDAMGVRWHVVDVRLMAEDYRTTGATDTWTLQDGAGVTQQGSYVRAVNGKRTLFAWLNGTLSSVGSCSADAASASFTMAAVAQGWIFA